MRLFVTRHGESETNHQNLVCGRLDANLTQKGEDQARELANVLVDKGIDLIFCSPLNRARRTAELANGHIGVPILFDDRLMEINFGTYEGTSRLAPEFLAIRNSFAGRFPEGESTCMVIQRIYNMLDEIKTTYPDKTILIVTHNVTSKSINAYCRSLSDKEFHEFRMQNCELVEYRLD